MKNWEEFVGINLRKPLKKVKHKELERIGSSIYRSSCPACKKGCLLVYRDQKDITKLLRNDVCILCGQHFYYTDLEYLGEIKGRR